METVDTELWKKELSSVFGDGRSAHLVNFRMQELKRYIETDTGDIFIQFANAVELFTSLTAINSYQIFTFTLSFTVMSKVFRQIGTRLKSTFPNVEEDKTFLALQCYQDSELRAEAVGLEDLLFTTNAYLNEIDKQTHESIVIRLEERFPTNDTVRFLGKLKAKAQELLTTSDIQSARRASVYINLYFRLAILRTLLLRQVYCIKQQRGNDQQSTQGVLAMINEGQKSDLEVVRYVMETSFQKAVFHTIFHPTENENFLHFLRIHQIASPCLGEGENFFGLTRNICLSKSSDIKFKMSSLYWGRICGSLKKTSASCEFKLKPVENRNLDNIFYIQSAKYEDFYVYMHEGGNCFSFKGQPGPDGQWKVVQLEDDQNQAQYILSPIKWPCRFLFYKCLLGNAYIGGTYDLKENKDNSLWKIIEA